MKQENYQKPPGAPAGISCFAPGGRGPCPHRERRGQGFHCAAFGGTMLYDAIKCPACLEAFGLPEYRPRFEREVAWE